MQHRIEIVKYVIFILIKKQKQSERKTNKYVYLQTNFYVVNKFITTHTPTLQYNCRGISPTTYTNSKEMKNKREKSEEKHPHT